MKIADIYKLHLIEEKLDELLLAGSEVSSETLVGEIEEYLKTNNLSVPRSKKEDFVLGATTEAIASDWRSKLQLMRTDMEVAFDGILQLSEKNKEVASRWTEEVKFLEARINGLTDRVENLLHMLSDSTGYLSYITESLNSENSFKIVDRELSGSITEAMSTSGNIATGDYIPAVIDTEMHTISLPPDTDGTSATTEIDLTGLTVKDVSFTVQSLKDVVSSSLLAGSSLLNAFDQKESAWKHIVRAKRPGKITASLIFKVGDTSQDITSLKILLHSVTPGSLITVTPQFSYDKRTWQFLPGVNLAKTGNDSIVFNFPTIQARYINLIFQKSNYDYEERGYYIYEFGAQRISLYNDSFPLDKIGFYQTRALSPVEGSNLLRIAKGDLPGGLFRFNRVSCEVCEERPQDTEIFYFVSVDDTTWHAIDPINRLDATKPQVIDFAESGRWTVEGEIKISYDTTKSLDYTEEFPGRKYVRIYWDSTDNTIKSTAELDTGVKRYIPIRVTHGILSHMFDKDIDVVPDKLQIWRNVGSRGTTQTVRNATRGWHFASPWYKTTVYISNPQGQLIDWGDRPVIIDEQQEQHGSVLIPYGIHTIRIHRANWASVTAGANSVMELVSRDPLYPYNHKLLVEGYDYGTSFPVKDQNYIGVDRYAECVMKRVDTSVFSSLSDEDYSIFAWRTGVPIDTLADYATAIQLKFSPQVADFINERFVIEFIRAEETWETIRFMAFFQTKDSSATPMLTKWSLRLSQ